MFLDAFVTFGATGAGTADRAVAIERTAFVLGEAEPASTIGIRLAAGFAVALGDANRGFASETAVVAIIAGAADVLLGDIDTHRFRRVDAAGLVVLTLSAENAGLI